MFVLVFLEDELRVVPRFFTYLIKVLCLACLFSRYSSFALVVFERVRARVGFFFHCSVISSLLVVVVTLFFNGVLVVLLLLWLGIVWWLMFSIVFFSF